MPAPIDLAGQQLGKLTAVRRDGRDRSGHPLWLFTCECGNTVHARAEAVTSGR